MEISTISLPRMNNGAHFLYNTDFYNRIEADTKVKNKVAEVLTRYKQAIDHEDEALTISRKSLNTDKIVEYDRRRDSLYVGIKSIVKAQLTVSSTSTPLCFWMYSAKRSLFWYLICMNSCCAFLSSA